MQIKGQIIRGKILDEETSCAHYHSEIDRIAIKFYCYNTYYPCYKCHEEDGCGAPAVWPKENSDEKAVLCGGCRYELRIEEYLDCKPVWPEYLAGFNPECGLVSGVVF